MEGIREKRKIHLSDLRIAPPHIAALAGIIHQEVTAIQACGQGYLINYAIDADDDSSFESQSPHIFQADGLLSRKVIEKVTMRFHTMDYSKHIEVQLTQLENGMQGDNFISVSGDDSHWVSGVLQQFIELENTVTPQSPYLSTLSVVNVIGWIGVCVFYYKLFSHTIENMQSDFWSVFLLVVPVGLFFKGCSLVDKQLIKMLPIIELQTGPEHLQLPKERRKRIAWLFSLFIIPLVLAVVYDVFKAYWFKI